MKRRANIKSFCLRVEEKATEAASLGKPYQVAIPVAIRNNPKRMRAVHGYLRRDASLDYVRTQRRATAAELRAGGNALRQIVSGGDVNDSSTYLMFPNGDRAVMGVLNAQRLSVAASLSQATLVTTQRSLGKRNAPSLDDQLRAALETIVQRAVFTTGSESPSDWSVKDLVKIGQLKRLIEPS